jgi:serine/threonine protein kinase
MLTHLLHPYIVRVQEYGLLDATPFLALDYIPNGSLRQHHPRGISVELSDVVHYVTQIAAALQYAHDHQIVHGDVKPENMLVNRDNEVMLSDFSLAFVTHNMQTDMFEMSIAYTAPERLSGHPCPASDQYALGLVVYEWLSGDHPFHGSFAEIAARQTLISPRSLRESVPDLPSAVAAVVHKALDKDPARRFGSVRAFADALEQASKPAWYEAPDIPTLLTPSIHSLLTSRPGVESSPVTASKTSTTWRNAPVQTLPAVTAPAQSTLYAEPSSPSTGEILKLALPSDIEQQPTRLLNEKKVRLPSRYSLLVACLIVLIVGSIALSVERLISVQQADSALASVPAIAGAYSGPLHNTRANIYATMTLAIQQKQEAINGDFTVGEPLLGNGRFTGTIDATKHIRFLVRSADTQAPILFWGALQPNGSLGGNYCSVNKNLQCDLQAGGRGVWSAIRTAS